MLLAGLVRYADDAAGLEKLLRLLQGFCTIACGLPAFADDVDTVLKLRAQFALGRRYFRFLKWHPCWVAALHAFRKQQAPVITLLEVGKCSFLGLYFFLEMGSIGNALGVSASEWAANVQREANKAWFYALVLSIILGLWQIASRILSATAKAPTQIDETPEQKPAVVTPAIDSRVYTQLIIDCCDLFIPGSAVGWIPVGLVFVGSASTVSSLLAGRQIWNRLVLQQRAS
ncbi:uncharacterized protein MYCFIDRAFT_36825 [Pseudocercospora fijiensis CIRAD86]|uniref:Uncharacterized protein n=1 Tax=Pseudocercospora fijiensis (strain CIRAD86) TaxID=383855 RepID=M2ZH57_PSEFD|nr:uncharacterized protein MYCFIDRAFT_36825 [Pseudocercospora fijiensis CIRAD86]EME78474.1 hypothetical protein MYCFIDRAFT_36825 [Pseudocercospora fijiensis CIRAD86]